MRLIGGYGGLAARRPFGIIDADSGVADDVAASAFAKDRPIYITSGTAKLMIDPTADASANTDAARFDILQQAADWQARCLARGLGRVKLFLAPGEHVMFGQLRERGGSFDDPMEMPPLELEADVPVHNEISLVSSIDFGAVQKRLVLINVTNGGGAVNGGVDYTSAPTVTITGGGGTGAQALSYILNGVVVAVVMLVQGSGFTSAPAIGFTGGGGTGATATAAINTSIWPALIPLTDPLPANVAVGMPIGVRGVTGTNDCGAVNGGHVITAFDTIARTVTIEVSAGAYAGTLTDGVATAGTVLFPVAWIGVAGGYTGGISGKEGFLNCNHAGRLKIRFMSFKFVDGPQQALKQSQSLYHCGIGDGFLHIQNDTQIVGFPGRALRVNQGSGTLNFANLGGGIYGNDIIMFQGGGRLQIIQSAIGGCITNALSCAHGSVDASASKFASAGRGIYAPGGIVNFQGCDIDNCFRGVHATDGGRGSCSTTANIRRCSIGIDWTEGGWIQGTPTFVGSLTSDSISSIAQGTLSLGGGWIHPTAGAPALQAGAASVTDVIASSLTFTAGGTLDVDGASATDAGSGVTINKICGRVTSQSLTTAAGSVSTIVVTNDRTPASAALYGVLLTRAGGTNTAGTVVLSCTPGVGSFTINITNAHASAAFNGTIIIFFLMVRV